MAQYVEFETSMGTIVFELCADVTPKTCQNFAGLADQGYYNDVTFHRIVNGFCIQGGDPTGTGKGGDSLFGGEFEDELTTQLKHTGAGILSMANSGPDTNKSQFFITLAPCPFLDGKHTVFGRVYSGMSVVQKIASVQTDANDRPLTQILIKNARLTSI